MIQEPTPNTDPIQQTPIPSGSGHKKIVLIGAVLLLLLVVFVGYKMTIERKETLPTPPVQTSMVSAVQKRVAVIMIRSANEPNFDHAIFQAKFQEMADSLIASSYGKFVLDDFEYFGDYVLPDEQRTPKALGTAISTADKDIDYTRFQFLVVVGANLDGFLGLAYPDFNVGQSSSDGATTIPLVVIDAGATPMADFPRVVAHELLHVRGIAGHANLLTFPSRTLGTFDLQLLSKPGQLNNSGNYALGDDGMVTQYGDCFDAMNSEFMGAHLNVVLKNQLGWLGSRLQSVTESGTHTINPLESSGDGVVGLKIPWPGSTHRFASYLEYRTTTPNGTPEMQIRIGSDEHPYVGSWLIDATITESKQGPSKGGKCSNYGLEVGKVFTDPNTGILFERLGDENGAASVRVMIP